jgi:hypothetical protein
VNQLESRVYELEKAVRAAQQTIRNLTAALQQAQQQIYASAPGEGGSGGGGGAVLLCTATAGIPAATGPPATGTPGGPITGQAIFSITGGAFVAGSTNVSVYNGMQSPTVTTKTLIVLANSDGTYTAVTQSCL